MTDLLERLQKVEPDLPGDRTRWYRNPDGHEAAAEIERLREALELITAYAKPHMRDDNEMKALDVALATLKEKD
jgi:hypothetical protein